MRIYNFFHEYSMQELDLALNELSASEYRDLEEIFDNCKEMIDINELINLLKNKSSF
mgnify:CR=1 FL=1